MALTLGFDFGPHCCRWEAGDLTPRHSALVIIRPRNIQMNGNEEKGL